MSIFGYNASASPLAVDVPPLKVYVSRATGNVAGRATFGDWTHEPRLNVLGVFYGSSVASPSYARLEGVTGQPASTQIDVENSTMIYMGDRVCIGFDETPFRPVFCGYMVQAQIQVADNEERITYRIAGPEWAWGSNGRNTGADKVVFGQWRRSPAADATWTATPATKTPFEDLIFVASPKTVFNPKGRGNRTLDLVEIADGFDGYIFEEPDRVVASSPVVAKSALWTRKNAIHYLLHKFNVESFTSIENPEIGDVDPTVAGDVMRDVDVTGATLWEALVKVCGEGMFFSVHPVPSSGYWGGFGVYFWSRASGSAASFVLSPRDTAMSAATASINRVEAVKDITKTANSIIVLGDAYRHLRLRYTGSAPTGDSAPYTLQPGWPESRHMLILHHVDNVIDEVTISNQGKTESWNDRCVTGGKWFEPDLYRRFVWNESGEFVGDVQYGSGSAVAYVRPNLTGIADGTGVLAEGEFVSGEYAIRRRPLLASAYSVEGKSKRFRKPPQVWLTSWFAADPSKKFVRRLPNSVYRIDPDMAAIWITAPDLATWRPFDYKADENDEGEKIAGPQDTFATMLWTGRLWLTVEASIEVDTGLAKLADRASTSGSPHRREAIVISESFVKSVEADQSSLGTDWESYSDASAVTIDDSTDATTIANQKREAGEDEQIHASLISEADWPIQTIGKMADSISGRGINLATISGRGAQIVAVSFDVGSMTIEHLTESAALEVVAAEKARIARRKSYQIGGMA